MDVIAYKFVYHSYTENTLLDIFSVNCLKSENLHWNKEEHQHHPINEEINKYDIVYSIQNIGNTKDEYGYLALNVKKQDVGNFLYTLEWVLLDESLPTTILNKFIEGVIQHLCNAKRENIEDTYRIDGIQTSSIHQVSPLHNPSERISAEIERLYMSSKQGYLQLSEDEEERLKNIAKKMNAPK